MPLLVVIVLVPSVLFVLSLQRRLAAVEGRLAAVERSVGFLGARDATP